MCQCETIKSDFSHKQSQSMSLMKSVLLSAVLLMASVARLTLAVGGVAEMKSLTGDAPYMGTGNQEQAPEYFGEAHMRQYYQNPAYDYYGNGGGSRYSRNYYNSMPYRNNFGGGGMLAGLLLPVPSYRPAMNVSPIQPSPFGGPSTSPFSGGFYSGGGNEWANRR